MNYTMKAIITCMTCMYAVALTMEGPIRRQASQSEKTVPIGGNVTLLCPFHPEDTWTRVYWEKNDQTIYSLEVKSNTPTTNDTRYEVSNHAKHLTIKDLKKTDGGIYHCKVVTLLRIEEGGQVLLSVTDQKVGLSTTSPGVPFRASTTTTIPPQPAEDHKSFFVVFSVSIIIINIIFVIIVCLVFKYRERIKNLLPGFRRQAPTSTSTPLDPDFSHLEIRDEAPTSSSTQLDPDSSHLEIRNEEGTRTDLLSSDTHGRGDVDVDDSQNQVQMHPRQERRSREEWGGHVPYINPNSWKI